ncbi:ribonuclease [Deinococcus sp.]|uniref:ribonuclease n=1 Tax=Deinococcus sp. TaxID=47478 RepID=UPI0025D686E5|nr:ribonuclease [Deinococcus sp.]
MRFSRFKLPVRGALLLCGALVACSSPARSSQSQASQTQASQSQSSQTRTAPATMSSTRRSLPAGARDPDSGLAFVARAALPPEGQKILSLIERGGPFPYARDGVSFGNREGVLPKRPRGEYREYTVRTPGSSDRGARRIVCGPPLNSSANCFYTGDHYASFRKVAP